MKKSKNDEDLLNWIESSIRRSLAKSSSWRTCAREDYAFYAGDQWDDDDKRKLESTGRVPIVFNRVARAVNAVSGMERQNRQQVAYTPREISDSMLAETVSDVARWARDMTDAEDEESEMFEDAIVCGMGWTELSMDYDQDPEGLIKEDRIDPLEMGWDMSAKKRNLVDAQFVFRMKEISRRDFKMQWPGIDPQPWDIMLTLDHEDPLYETPGDGYRSESDFRGGNKDKAIKVAQFQWWEKEAIYKFEFNGQAVTLDKDQYNTAKEDLEKLGIEAEKVNTRRYYQAFINSKQILEVDDGPCKYDFSFQCCTGYRDRNKNTWFGLVSLMKDPQRYANKWLSQIVYILATNSKGGLMAEKDAFANINEAQDQWSSPDAITWLNPGGIQKIQEKTMASFPSGLDQLLGYAMEAISDVPGVNQEMMGVANREQSGYLENQRKQAGLTILSTFFDSKRRYNKINGRVLMSFIREYIPEGKMIRVGSIENAQYVPLVKDNLSYTFDIVVDDSPTSPNMKERIFGIISSLIPVLVPNGYPIPPEVLDYSPLPSALVNAWKKAAEPPPPDPIQVQKQEMIEQLSMQGMDANNQKTLAQVDEIKTGAQLNVAKAVNEMQNAEAPVPGMDARANAEIEEIYTKSRLNMAKAEAEIKKANTPEAAPEQANPLELEEIKSKSLLNAAKTLSEIRKANEPYKPETPSGSKPRNKKV